MQGEVDGILAHSPGDVLLAVMPGGKTQASASSPDGFPLSYLILEQFIVRQVGKLPPECCHLWLTGARGFKSLRLRASSSDTSLIRPKVSWTPCSSAKVHPSCNFLLLSYAAPQEDATGELARECFK